MGQPAYLRISDKEIKRQVQLTYSIIVDVSESGQIVGVENLDGPIGFDELITVVSSARLGGP